MNDQIKALHQAQAVREKAVKDMTDALSHQPAQATQAEVTDEREAFESCALMEGSLFKRRADDPDKYWDGNVQDDWELWQARAILALRPERVMDVRCEGCGYMTHHREHMGCVRAAKQHIHPAPSVPDEKPLPELMMASYHEAIGWNACRAAMLAAK